MFAIRRTSIATAPLLRAAYSTPAAAPPTLDASLRTSLKTSMKARDSFRTTVLKSLLSDLTQQAHNPSPPSPSKSLSKAISTRRDAVKTFLSSSPPRADLAEQYEREIAILQEFVSEEAKSGMGKEELAEVVRRVLEEMGAVLVEGKVGGKEVGQVIKRVVEKVAGGAGGKDIAEAVRSFGGAAK